MRLLWDFDGTIMDTYPVYTKTIIETVPRLRKQFTYEEVMAAMKVSFAFGFETLQLTPEEIKRCLRAIETIDPAEIKPFEAVIDVLKMAEVNVIMSHKEKSVLQTILQAHHLVDYFTEIVTPEDGFPRKPSEESYAYLHAKYDLTAAIGDRALDLIPAKKINLRTIMFQNDCEAADRSVSHYEDFTTVWKTF